MKLFRTFSAFLVTAVLLTTLFGPVSITPARASQPDRPLPSGNPPTLTSALYDPASGVLTVTAADMTTGDVINVNKLTLTGEYGETYTLTTSNVMTTSTIEFTITLNALDRDAVNLIMNKPGFYPASGDPYNIAAADDWDANYTAGDTSDPSNQLEVADTLPMPGIDSAYYDSANGKLVIFASNLLKLNSSEDIATSAFTLSGQGGSHTLSSSANVELSSADSFVITLSYADREAVNLLLNKNGTTALDGTPYNLAVADNWLLGYGYFVRDDISDPTSPVTTSGIQSPITLDDSGMTGIHPSMVIVNGNPAITYLDLSSSSIKYIRAANTYGTSWNTPITISGTATASGTSSPYMAIVNGNPAVVFYDGNRARLNYVRASDANGTAWGTPIEITGFTTGFYEYPSLVIANGNPAISFYDSYNTGLYFIRAIDANGTTWGTPSVVDNVGETGQYASMTLVDNYPAISYYEQTQALPNKAGDLYYIQATAMDGSSWGGRTRVNTGYATFYETGLYISLGVINNAPVISYYNSSIFGPGLNYVRIVGSNLMNWTYKNIDRTNPIGNTSLNTVNGMPAISYYDAVNKDLKYVAANDIDGISWGLPMILDSAGMVGVYSSLKEIGGYPAIAYYDTTNTSLKYVRFSDEPRIASITPFMGSQNGATSITINGINLSGGTVQFDGVPVASCTIHSNTQISCITPSHAVQKVDVSVTSTAGTGLVPDGFRYLSSEKAITGFYFRSPNMTATINESAHTIDLILPYGADPSALVANFVSTGASVSVGAAAQISGTTANDFSSPLTYTVTAEDGSTQNYLVTVTVAPDSIPPTVTSIVRADANPANTASVNFTVTFSEPVINVDTSDFSLFTSAISSAAISNVSGSGITYTVTISTGTGSGTLRLDVPVTATITDSVGNVLNGLPFTNGEAYDIDKTAPAIVSSIRADANPTSATNVDFTVTFSEDVTGVNVSDFILTTSNVWSASISGVSGSGKVYTVSVSTGSGTGSLRLDVPVSASINDLLGNPLTSLPYTAGEAYELVRNPIFADVPFSVWTNSWIERLYNNGITGGCGIAPLIYCPDKSVTRAEMAVFLVRGMHGRNFSPPQATGIFGDVPTSHWAAAWIEQLYADGITGGCSASPLMYCPEQTATTRAQMAVFLLRAEHGAGYTPPLATGVFADVPTTYWAAAWIEQLASEGITSGCGGGNYCPDQAITRAQMAVFLVKTFNLP